MFCPEELYDLFRRELDCLFAFCYRRSSINELCGLCLDRGDDRSSWRGRNEILRLIDNSVLVIREPGTVLNRDLRKTACKGTVGCIQMTADEVSKVLDGLVLGGAIEGGAFGVGDDLFVEGRVREKLGEGRGLYGTINFGA